MNLKNKKLTLIVIVSIIILVLIGVFIAYEIGPYDRKNKKDIVIDIPSGSSVSNISNILYENKLIKNKVLFKLVVKLSNDSHSIKAGKYLVNQTYSNKDILDLLISGKVYNDGMKVTIPEGLTSNEVIDILVDKKIGNESKYKELINNPSKFYEKYSFLKEKDIKSLEGFLYPDTYYFSESDDEFTVISTMISRFNSQYSDEFIKRQKELNMTLEQVINIASIIEKEAVLDKDRPLIASVFYNRLKIGMPLQSDATIQYIFDERKKIVTYDDLKIDSPYNTYINKGMPPTPISNPGIESIKAALYPEKTDYLYFVATIDGGNNYSTNYEDHLKYVKEYKDARDKLKQENSTDKK